MQQSVLHVGASPYLPNGGRYKSFEDSILLLSFFHCSLKTEYLNKLKVSYILVIMQFDKLYHFIGYSPGSFGLHVALYSLKLVPIHE